MKSCQVLLVTLAAVAPAAGSDDVESLIAAERGFAAASEARGMRSAFLENLAEGAVIFRPGPVDGRAWFETQPEPPGTLAWGPAIASLAGSGDLGYTSGPWEFRPPEGSQQPGVAGHFVSVWRRTDGAWKVVLDTGITHAPGRPAGQVDVLPARPAVPDPSGARAQLLDADRRLAEAARQSGVRQAYRAVSAEDVRVYRDGHLPTVGRGQVGELLSAEIRRWETAGGDCSADGSLGYTYGIAYRERDDGPAAALAYLRIWGRGSDGGWLLLLDAGSPMAAPGG